jgi:hypothetical protein
MFCLWHASGHRLDLFICQSDVPQTSLAQGAEKSIWRKKLKSRGGIIFAISRGKEYLITRKTNYAVLRVQRKTGDGAFDPNRGGQNAEAGFM